MESWLTGRVVHARGGYRRSRIALRSSDCKADTRRRSSDSIGTTQRRLAWRLRTDDMHKSRRVLWLLRLRRQCSSSGLRSAGSSRRGRPRPEWFRHGRNLRWPMSLEIGLLDPGRSCGPRKGHLAQVVVPSGGRGENNARGATMLILAVSDSGSGIIDVPLVPDNFGGAGMFGATSSMDARGESATAWPNSAQFWPRLAKLDQKPRNCSQCSSTSC